MIISFYSYKGGVGRTQLLVNVAASLCYNFNKKVLLIDWDLEAPGLPYFFEKINNTKKGLIDLFVDYLHFVKISVDDDENLIPKIDSSFIQSGIKLIKGCIDLVTSGSKENYAQNVNSFNWEKFYNDYDGKGYIEWLKENLNQLDYDYIFIDSRTGISDYSGICNIQLPEMNVFVVAPTYQNYNGAKEVADFIIDSEYVKEGLREPFILPILSRVDPFLSHKEEEWVKRYKDSFIRHLDYIFNYLDNNTSNIDDFINRSYLNYNSELSYGENIVFTDNSNTKLSRTLHEQFNAIAELIIRIKEKNKAVFFNQYASFADEKVLEKIWQAKQSKSTRLSILFEKSLKDLTPLKDLTQLQELNVSSTQVSDLTPLKDLTQLQELNVSSTQVSDLTPLKDLTQLQRLNVSSTQVSDLTPLKDLTQLQELNVSSTQVSDLTPLKDLTQLQGLDAHETQVSDLTPLKDLTQLQRLDIHSTQVSDLTPLKGLTQLQELWIFSTQVSDLKSLKDLMQLQRLDVSCTQVSDLTPLKDLTQLQLLWVSSTQVSDLTPLKDLTQLQQLWIDSTQVSDLTPLKKIIKKGVKVNWSKDKNGINVEDCPLRNPPKEIVEQGNEAILNYWQQIAEQGGTETLNEAKLIIVGEGKSGKTTLFNKLIDPKYVLKHLDETHGINIHEGLEMNDGFRANLWDFGGQELQYMTHQFFLTPRALYVLMMDARAESPNLAYWFKIISLLGKDKDSEKISLLLVFNKRKGSIGSGSYYEILKHYENDFDYVPLEVDFGENDTRWACLKETIEKRLIDLPIVKNEIPKQWKPIREALRKEAKKKNYISTDRLAKICSTYQVNTEASQFQLTQYLHQLGSILHFQNDPDLSDTVILSSEWAVEGVYTVLKSEGIKANHGKFKAEDIFHILKSKKYTHQDCIKILKLMSKNNFDVCYQSESGDYVAAQLLPENAPPQYKWDTETGSLPFRYQYPIMPKGLMSRLIVRMSNYLETIEGAEIVWKKGAILRMEKNNQVCRVMMCEDDAESKSGLREIIIEVVGDIAYRKFALQKVRDEVEKIHQKWFKNIKVDEMVPCCCDDCKANKKPFKFALNRLLHLQNVKNKTTIGCQESGESVSIIQLLEGVYDKGEINAFSKEKSAVHIENYHHYGGQANIADKINEIKHSK